MATYRNPTYKPMQPGGTMPVKQAHRLPVSVANERSEEYAPVKTDGIQIRGTGAATKGTKARGPMA